MLDHFDAFADRLAAIQPDPEPQPVAATCANIARVATPSSAGTVSVEAAARVLLDGFERAQIDSSIIKLFQNGQHFTALRALAGEGER